MSDDFIYRKDCRLCGSTNIVLDLALAPIPIGDRYVPEADKQVNSKIYPLDIMLCHDCGHYQNSGCVQPDLIYNHYLSRPATTNAVLSGAYSEYADYLLSEFKSAGQPFSIETGSNDGAFSRYMQQKGAKVLCIEPAKNLAEQANNNHIPTIQNYFSFALAKEIKEKHGQADYFIANHMFANVDDVSDFVRGIEHLLSDTGVFSMQTFYQLDVIDKKLIENYTHEHISYFYIKPLQRFCKRHGLELFDVKRVPAKGGSIRCFIQKQGGPRQVSAAVSELIKLEESYGMGKAGAQDTVKNFIAETKQQFRTLLLPIKQSGKMIAGFGTSIGTTTFVYNYGLGDLLSFFVDDDPYRQNLVSPGFHIPVLSSKAIEDKKPAVVVLLAPLYADNIMNKNKAYLEAGGEFIKFWPHFERVKSKEPVSV